MVEHKKQKLLTRKENLFSVSNNTETKEDIPIEKGAVVGESFMINNQKLLEQYMDYFIAYPDLFLDLISGEDCPIKLFFFQRILLRALMRFKEIFITAGRATSKTTLSILAGILQCIFIPGRRFFIVATYKTQAAKVSKQVIETLLNAWPLLKREIVGWQLNDIPGKLVAHSL